MLLFVIYITTKIMFSTKQAIFINTIVGINVQISRKSHDLT